MKIKRIKYLISFILTFLIEAVIAVFIHDNFIRPYLGDVLIIICVYLFFRTIFLDKFKYLSLYVLILAVLIETLQYFNIAKIIAGDNKLVNIVLGATFDIKDIICYVIGYAIILIIEKIYRRENYKNEY